MQGIASGGGQVLCHNGVCCGWTGHILGMAVRVAVCRRSRRCSGGKLGVDEGLDLG